MSLVFVDTETTGLDLDRHEIWEIGFAVDDGPVHEIQVPHSLANADPKALEINGYLTRARDVQTIEDLDLEIALKAALKGATFVGANPAFDAYRLERRWGVAPWKYRLLDLESFAMPILGYPVPMGLKTITEDLASLGFDVTPNDHTAGADVEAVRSAYWALWGIREERQGFYRTGGAL